jgi:hypothetical protein
MISKPANRPALGALRFNFASEDTEIVPTILVVVVRIMVTPVPLVLSQLEHLSTPPDFTVKLPVIQYIPGDKSMI